MNDQAIAGETTARAPARDTPPSAWPKGQRLGCFELQDVVARGAAGVVYRAWDHQLALPVAIKEYLPAGLAARSADGHVQPAVADGAVPFERGLQVFVDEARHLAHCDHPHLLRVLHLVQAHGTAYRVMPWYTGTSLLEVRRDMAGPPDEAALRRLLDGLLGALEAWQRVGGVHGGLHPAQVLLLDDDRALLLGPGAARQPAATDAPLRRIEPGFAPPEQQSPSATASPGPWTDFYALAELARFCITGMMPPLLRPEVAEPLADTVQRLFFDMPTRRYGDALLRTLDAAASPTIGQRPQTAAQFRAWLAGASPADDQRDSGEAETMRLIQRALASVPPAPPNPRPRRLAETAVPPWDADMAARHERVAVMPPPQRRGVVAALVVVLLGASAAGSAWHWQDELAVLRDEALARLTPVAAAPPSRPPAVAVAVVPSVEPVPAPLPAAPAVTETSAAPPAARVDDSAAADPPPTRPSRAPARPVPASPRELCSGRSEFSLYRCMQQQCGQVAWRQHPQCLRLKATDRVD